MTAKTWPFPQSPDTLVLTLRSIVLGGAPILRATHDLDGGWQFISLADANPADAALIAFQKLVAHDPSLRTLSSLPPGWHAFRPTPDSPWTTDPAPQALD